MINRIAFLVALSWVCAFVATAQVPPPPPPPPLIYSPPDAKEIREFSDAESKFRVSFPGVPEKETSLGGKVPEVSYKMKRKGSNSSVTVLTFPTSMEPHREKLYESYRKDLAELTAKGPSGIPANVSVVSFDRELTVNGVKGREFGYESDFHFTHVAIFVRGNLFFEVKTDVTNWHILKHHYPEIVKAFDNEASRFIGSFTFTP